MYRIDEGKRAAAAPRLLSGRGVAYWTDGRGDERIFMVTPGYQLVALDAKNGDSDPHVRSERDSRSEAEQRSGARSDYRRNRLEHGTDRGQGCGHRGSGASRRQRAAQQDERERVHPRLRRQDGQAPVDFPHHSDAGRVRQRDLGKRLLVYSGNAGMWGPFSVDEELGMVYLPIELSTGDYYGGHRPGDNLFTESLVAVDLQTGKRMWHFQLVHHGIWDYDLPCAPILADITVDGKRIKAVALPSKQGFLYVFDRQTGQPVWPIVERPVEKGTVPGEWYSPTQPFPTKPPPFELQGIQEKDLIDFTPEILAEAKKVASTIKLGPLFTPPIVRGDGGKIGTAYIANGANWPGGSYDPETGILYVFSNSLTRLLVLAKIRSDRTWITSTPAGAETPAVAAVFLDAI